MPVLTNSKRELFAQALAAGNTADEAYKAAGYNPHRANAARMSANEDVRSRVQEILSASAERAGITRERIQAELAKIAFGDIRKAVRWGDGVLVKDESGFDHVLNDVALVASNKIDDDTACAISEVRKTKEGMSIKMYDKQKALELLGKDIGMFVERLESSVTIHDVSDKPLTADEWEEKHTAND